MYIFKSANETVMVVNFITGVDLGKSRTKKERGWCAALISVWKWKQVELASFRFFNKARDCGLCKEFGSFYDNCSHCPLSESNLLKTHNEKCGTGSLYNDAYIYDKIAPLINELKRIVAAHL